MVRVLKKATEDEDKYFPGVLGNPVMFAARWGLPLSKSYRRFRARELAAQRRHMNRSATARVGEPVNIKLPKGNCIKSVAEGSNTPKFLTYCKGREARVYQVDCELWAGSYWLKKVYERGQRVRGSKRELSLREAQSVVNEVLACLRTHGFSAEISPYACSSGQEDGAH